MQDFVTAGDVFEGMESGLIWKLEPMRGLQSGELSASKKIDFLETHLMTCFELVFQHL
jgi:hypothetical protein